jgi:hypothetical protein
VNELIAQLEEEEKLCDIAESDISAMTVDTFKAQRDLERNQACRYLPCFKLPALIANIIKIQARAVFLIILDECLIYFKLLLQPPACV